MKANNTRAKGMMFNQKAGEYIQELEAELAEYEYPLRTKKSVTVPVDVWDAREQQLATLRQALVQYCVAMEFTRQYVGYEALPPIKGWSWYDADENAKEALQEKGE